MQEWNHAMNQCPYIKKHCHFNQDLYCHNLINDDICSTLSCHRAKVNMSFGFTKYNVIRHHKAKTTQAKEDVDTITTELTSILVSLIGIVILNHGFNYRAINYKDYFSPGWLYT